MAPSLFLVTDLGCILSADETVLTSVLRHVTRDVPPAPADVAALLLRMGQRRAGDGRGVAGAAVSPARGRDP